MSDGIDFETQRLLQRIAGVVGMILGAYKEKVVRVEKAIVSEGGRVVGSGSSLTEYWFKAVGSSQMLPS